VAPAEAGAGSRPAVGRARASYASDRLSRIMKRLSVTKQLGSASCGEAPACAPGAAANARQAR
jgi:hypothetical protein